MSAQKRSCVTVLTEANSSILFDALDAIDGAKIIIWDPTIIKRFNLVATAEQLKQHKVVSMLQLEFFLGVPQAEHSHVVYILSAYNTSVINKLISCLKHAHSINVSLDSVITANFIKDSRLHHALLVPETTFMIRDALKQSREASLILQTLESLPLKIFPLYDDFFTLFMDNTPSKILLDNDWTELQKCASAIRQLESLGNYSPNLRCKGKWSAQVVEIVKKMRTQDEALFISENSGFRLTDIIIIDRWIDPLTPLLIQLTYAGLVDELLDMSPTGNIKASKVRNVNEKSDVSSEISLHDPLFRTIRDLHIKDLGKQIAEILSSLREERARLKENPPSDSLAESKVFVRRLLDMQGSEKHADTHTMIAECLMNYVRDDSRYSTFPKLAIDIVLGEYGDRVISQIENLIVEAYDPLIVARFIVLQCLVLGGLKHATISAYERLFVQSYGAYYLSLWIKLKLMGLLWEKNSKIKCEYAPFDFQVACNRMSCFVDEEHTTLGTTAYPYNSYVPLIVRHIENGVRNAWRDWTTIMGDDYSAIDRSTYSVIFVIGGITQAELACFRQIHFPNKLLVVSTALITAFITQRMVDSVGCAHEMHDSVAKVEKLVADMTHQLIASANRDEYIEVELKMLFGKFVKKPVKIRQQSLLTKDIPATMRSIPGTFDATAVAIGKSTILIYILIVNLHRPHICGEGSYLNSSHNKTSAN